MTNTAIYGQHTQRVLAKYDEHIREHLQTITDAKKDMENALRYDNWNQYYKAKDTYMTTCEFLFEAEYERSRLLKHPIESITSGMGKRKASSMLTSPSSNGINDDK